MSSLSLRLQDIHRRMEAACHKAQRPPNSVQLICVSKLHPSSAIEEAWQAGERHFGENYAQELRDKAQNLQALEGLVFHFIGPLQANKAKYVAKAASTFHALEDLAIAQELSKRRVGAPLRCFIEVNVGDEASKSGVSFEEAPRFLEALRALPNLEVIGLMGLPPLTDNPEEARPHFRRLAELAKSLGLKELSMGTTSDFEVAIEEGATYVRVGTAIFGERPKRT